MGAAKRHRCWCNRITDNPGGGYLFVQSKGQRFFTYGCTTAGTGSGEGDEG